MTKNAMGKSDNSDRNTQDLVSKLYKQEDKDKFPEKLISTRGNISLACKALRISRETYYEWKRNDKEFAQECEVDIWEYIAGYVESKLFSLIEEGNIRAIIFYCQTKLKDRGYGKSLEVTSAIGESSHGSVIETKARLDKLTDDELKQYIFLVEKMLSKDEPLVRCL
jgi:hypothetical protein